jgi:hypothetical protein
MPAVFLFQAGVNSPLGYCDSTSSEMQKNACLKPHRLAIGGLALGGIAAAGFLGRRSCFLFQVL